MTSVKIYHTYHTIVWYTLFVRFWSKDFLNLYIPLVDILNLTAQKGIEMDYNYGNGNYNGYNNGNNGGKRPSNFMLKLAQFMYGRYGADNLYKFLVVFALVLILVGRVTHIEYFNLASIAVFIYATFRMYSKNIFKRQQENLKYLKLTAPIRNRFYAAKYKKQQQQAKEADTSHIYLQCGRCGQELRVPRNVGTIDATCPNCGARTRVKTNMN